MWFTKIHITWHSTLLSNSKSNLLSPKRSLDEVRGITQSFFQENQNHAIDINERDKNGMNILMHAIIQKNEHLVQVLLDGVQATRESIRKKIDLNALNIDGASAKDLAMKYLDNNKPLIDQLSVENDRRKRITTSMNVEKGYYHETDVTTYQYVQTDVQQNRFPMIGGNGGYFGGGIYFAVTPYESSKKSLKKGRGFECTLKLGNVLKIENFDQYNDFIKTYCSNSLAGPYSIPTDVMRTRLLTFGKVPYDSVWGHQNTSIDPSNSILQSGDEMVVYSADQVSIKRRYHVVFDYIWIPMKAKETASKPSSREAGVYVWVNVENIDSAPKKSKIGDIVITNGREYFVVLPDRKLHQTTNGVIPLAATTKVNDVIDAYKPFLPFFTAIEIDPQKPEISRLFTKVKYQHELFTHVSMFANNRIVFYGKDFSYESTLQNGNLADKDQTLVITYLSDKWRTIRISFDIALIKENSLLFQVNLIPKLWSHFYPSMKGAKLANNGTEIEIQVQNENEEQKVKTDLIQFLSSRREPSSKQFAQTTDASRSSLNIHTENIHIDKSTQKPIHNSIIQHGDIVLYNNNGWIFNEKNEFEDIFVRNMVVNNRILTLIPTLCKYTNDGRNYYNELAKILLKTLKNTSIQVPIRNDDKLWKEFNNLHNKNKLTTIQHSNTIYIIGNINKQNDIMWNKLSVVMRNDVVFDRDLSMGLVDSNIDNIHKTIKTEYILSTRLRINDELVKVQSLTLTAPPTNKDHGLMIWDNKDNNNTNITVYGHVDFATKLKFVVESLKGLQQPIANIMLEKL